MTWVSMLLIILVSAVGVTAFVAALAQVANWIENGRERPSWAHLPKRKPTPLEQLTLWVTETTKEKQQLRHDDRQRWSNEWAQLTSERWWELAPGPEPPLPVKAKATKLKAGRAVPPDAYAVLNGAGEVVVMVPRRD